tara:strand:+ start:50 stop:406 length:357 start_codon:yes stop_codon:yes gene_type:complete
LISGKHLEYKVNLLREIMFAWLMNFMSKIFGNTAEINMSQDQNGQALMKGNWMGPDGTESGPNVPEDWYLTYDGPAPIVEGVYDENYAVDRGNGVIPVDFYIDKWGLPENSAELTDIS